MQRGLFRIGEELHDRRFPFAVLDLDEGKALGPEIFRNRSHLVDLADGDAGKTLGVDRLHHSAARDDGTEKFEAAFAKLLGEIDQLHAETAIRLVAPERAHRLAIGHAREGRRDIDPA